MMECEQDPILVEKNNKQTKTKQPQNRRSSGNFLLGADLEADSAECLMLDNIYSPLAGTWNMQNSEVTQKLPFYRKSLLRIRV